MTTDRPFGRLIFIFLRLIYDYVRCYNTPATTYGALAEW